MDQSNIETHWGKHQMLRFRCLLACDGIFWIPTAVLLDSLSGQLCSLPIVFPQSKSHSSGIFYTLASPFQLTFCLCSFMLWLFKVPLQAVQPTVYCQASVSFWHLSVSLYDTTTFDSCVSASYMDSTAMFCCTDKVWLIHGCNASVLWQLNLGNHFPS